MKKFIISLLALISFNGMAQNSKTEPINKTLSKVYSTKTFARGKLDLQNIESKENIYLYYDGTFKQVNLEDGHYTIEIQNPDKLNILIVHPDSITVKAEPNEKNKILGIQVTDTEFQFFIVTKENKNDENKPLAEWNIKENRLEKDDNLNFNVPANTLIVPIYNKKFSLNLANTCWKSDYNSICLPTITIRGKQKEVDATLRKACWLHLKISQLHSEQTTRVKFWFKGGTILFARLSKRLFAISSNKLRSSLTGFAVAPKKQHNN